MVSSYENMSPAPDDLDFVGAFVNTWEGNSSRPDVEELATPADLESWLAAAGVEVENLDAADLVDARAFREALRELLAANHGEELPADAVEVLRAASGRAALRVDVDASANAAAVAACSGVEALFARVLAAIARAQATGTWERLKVCRADDCRWAFYDASRNHSRSWCSMEVCGNRAKTRRYRKRGKPA